MGRRIYRHRYRRRAGSPEFFSVLAALIVLSLTGAGAVVWPLLMLCAGAVVLTVAVFALKLIADMVSVVVQALTT